VRKKQPLADALALSDQLIRIEDALMRQRLTLRDADEIDEIVRRVRELEEAKVIVVPALLRRVRRLAGVGRSLRAAHTRATSP